MFSGSTKELIESIDLWENVYFDIADATLRHQYPAVHERLFLNLTKSSGPQVILNVETFLRRLGELEQEGGEEIDSALALLDKRGLTRNRRDAAQAQVGEATSLEVTEAPPQQPAYPPPQTLGTNPLFALMARLVFLREIPYFDTLPVIRSFSWSSLGASIACVGNIGPRCLSRRQSWASWTRGQGDKGGFMG